MEQVNTILHQLDTLVTSIASSNATKGDFAHACAEVDMWKTIEEAVRTKASRARQQRNALLPIQQLPTEVVVRVLHMAVAPFREQAKYYTILKQLSVVCHRLRRIIHGTSAFWSRIYVSDPPHIVDEALKRSAAHDLDVRYEVGCGMALGIFVQKLTPHIDRCRKVEVDYYALGLEHLQKFLALPAPRLEQLVLRNIMPVRGFITAEIFVEQATRLREVEIRGVPCRWEAAAFRGLESLRISDVSFQSFNQILGLLHHSPCLLKLELDCRITSYNSLDIDPTFRQINLPLLRNVSISFNNPRYTETIFDCIQLPSCADLRLGIPREEQDIPDHIARLSASWLGQAQIAIPNSRSINIAMASSDTTLSIPRSDGGALSLALVRYLDSAKAARVLEGANRVIVDHLVTSESSLQLDNRIFTFLDDRNFLDQLIRLPSVTRLDIKNPDSDLENLPDWTAEEHWTFPLFPSLKFLRLCNQSEEWILHIVRALFLSPALGVKNRIVNVEVYFRTEEDRDRFPSAIADTIKEVIGEGNRLSFMLAPNE